MSIFERKILRRIYGSVCEGVLWRKIYNRELEALYHEPNTVNVIKLSILRWVGHVVRMDEHELPKKILWTNSGGQRSSGRPKSRWIDGVEEDAKKLGCENWRADAKDRVRWWHAWGDEGPPRAVEPVIIMIMIIMMITSNFKSLHSATDGQSVYLDLQLHLVHFDSYISIVKRRSFCREDRSYLSI